MAYTTSRSTLRSPRWPWILCLAVFAAFSANSQNSKPVASSRLATGSTAELDALIKAAKVEGEVTVYSSASESVTRRVAPAFSEKYGIKTQVLRLASTPLMQRYASEAETGNISADVLLNAGSSVAFAEEGLKKGWVEPIPQAGLPVVKSGEYPARFSRSPTALIQAAPWLIMYNTEKVKAADVPKDWPDLLNPKWKGQIIIPNPGASDAYIDLWALLIDKYGEAFISSIRAQNPRMVSSGAVAQQSLSAGEGSLALPQVPSSVSNLRDKGAPVDQSIPDYTTGVEIQVTLTNRTKSRHPNAGRLFANYVMSLEGNKLVNADPGGVTIYAASGLPKEYQSPKAGTYARKDQIMKLFGL